MIDTWLPSIKSQLVELCSRWDVPLGIPIGWIQVESGGHLKEVTSLDERGYFQLIPEESQQLLLDHLRLSSDVSYSLEAGFRLMDYYRSRIRSIAHAVRTRYLIEGSEYQWRMIKFAHSIGQGAARIILSDAAQHNSDISWDMLKSYALQHEDYYMKRIRHSPAKWLTLVDTMITIGQPFGVECLRSQPPVT